MRRCRAGVTGFLFCLLLGGVTVRHAGGRVVPPHLTWVEEPQTTVTISWERDTACRATVRYGTSTNYTHTIHDSGAYRAHCITLRDLQPGTLYHYTISCSDGYVLPDHTFRTAPPPTGSLHLVVHGDLHGGIDTNWARSVASRIVAEEPDLVIHMGDMSIEDGIPGFSTWDQFFSITTDELERVVFMPVPGNHDYPEEGSANYFQLFPAPDRPRQRSCYSFDAAGVHFVALNSDFDLEGQTNWLARDLQAAMNDTNVNWIVPFFHRPPYSWGEREGYEPTKTNWCPVFVRYNADRVFSGHSHNYQRTVPIRGVVYNVAGGGGGDPYTTAFTPESHEFATTCYHHVSIQLTGTVMRQQAVRSDGLVFDDVVVTNRERVVRYIPSFPRRGESVRILYDASQGPLAGAGTVYLHLGIDEFSSALISSAMTYQASSGRWEYELVVPTNAEFRLAFVFYDGGSTWDNNYDHGWQALLGRVDFRPAYPHAGSNVLIRYDAAIGPLGSGGPFHARVTFNREAYRLDDVELTNNPANGLWEGVVPVPGYATQMEVAFRSGDAWDENEGMLWPVQVQGACLPAPWRPLPMVVPGTPVISTNPPPQNNPGDRVDFNRSGMPLTPDGTAFGFGDFGQIYFNCDSSNLYVGGYGADAGGTNNVFVLFLGLDTLSDDAPNLWHKSGLPNALDELHNVGFMDPMDIAIVFGDEYGDGASYSNFTYGGYNFGQGIFYLGTNTSEFVPVAGARMSQFDGEETNACVSADDDGNPQTDRWEASLPWSSLNAPGGVTSVHHLLVSGVIGSDSTADNNRYLSSTYIGRRAFASRDVFRQVARSFVMLAPQQVLLGAGDVDGDGLPNDWEHENFGSAEGPAAADDADGDGQDNWIEYVGGSEPTNAASVFGGRGTPAGDGEFVLEWTARPDRRYTVGRGDSPGGPFVGIASNLLSGGYTDTVTGVERAYYRVGAGF